MQNDLESLFSEVGEVAQVFLPDDRSTGRPRGFAFVEFKEKTAAAEAIQRFDGQELNGRSIRVSEAEEQQPRSSGFSNANAKPYTTHQGARGSKPKSKGSRRNIRARKRGF